MKDAQHGATRQEAMRKNEEEVRGCGERGYADSWRDRRRCRGQREKEDDDLLWRLVEKLSGAERGRRLCKLTFLSL